MDLCWIVWGMSWVDVLVILGRLGGSFGGLGGSWAALGEARLGGSLGASLRPSWAVMGC